MKAVDVKTESRSARNAQKCAVCQRLHFHSQRAPAVKGHDNGRPGKGRVARSQKKCGRIVYNLHPFLPHVKDKQFLIGTKTVLENAQEPEHLPAVAFQRNDRVNHVLEQPWACKGAVLGYMTHQDQRCVRRPAGFEQARGHGPDLVDIAGQAFRGHARQGLHRIHNHKGWPGFPEYGQDVFHAGG